MIDQTNQFDQTSQTATVSGENAQVFQVGGDYIERFEGQVDFYSPGLSKFEDGRHVRPSIHENLLKQLQTDSILILGGATVVDKDSFARHLAWDIAQQSDSSGLEILEWYRSSDPQRITAKLEERENSSVFILGKIGPEHINYDLAPLVRVVSETRHYVIISTDTPQQLWRLDERFERFWVDIPQDGDIYRLDDLFDYLLDELHERQESLPDDLGEGLEKGLSLADTIAPGVSIEEVLKSLKTPDNIGHFCDLLTSEQIRLTTAKDVSDLIQRAQDQRAIVRKWFYQYLDRREQLLVLALCFFDGLMEDQFFAAFEEIVNKSWAHKEERLRGLDYFDLERLQEFINLVEVRSGGRRMEIRVPGHRQIILGEAWQTHRRHIIAALASLTTLVRGSVRSRSHNTELYGSYQLRRQLRLVIGDVLSDLAEISIDSLETAFLELAADPEPGVQRVAALAMARWHQEDTPIARQRLRSTLERWQTETRLYDLVDAIYRSRNKESEAAARGRAFIRATVALTLSYTALFTPPGDLFQWQINLFSRLAQERDELVQNRFRIDTLPHFVIRHPTQIKAVLHSLLEDRHLVPYVGVSLAVAYKYHPQDIIAILSEWSTECYENRSPHYEPNVISHRESLLATFVLTYGEIDYNETSGPLYGQQNWAISTLTSILTEERHPFVRQAVAQAVARLASRYFDVIEKDLQQLVERLDSSEVDTFVQTLRNTYLQQRQQLTGGNDQILVAGKWYDIWYNPSERPRTGIEQATARWLSLPKTSQAYSVAVRARDVFLSALVQAEEQHIERYYERERQRYMQAQQPYMPPPQQVLNPKEELARLIAMKNQAPQRFNLYMLELERDDPQAARRLMRDIRRQEGCLSFLYSSVLMVIGFGLLAASSWALYGVI